MKRVTRSILAATVGFAGLALCACGGGSASAGASTNGASASVSVSANAPTANASVTLNTQQTQVQPAGGTEWVHAPIFIEFETGGIAVTDNMRRQIVEVVQTARTRTDIVRVRVEGHADSRGNSAANQQLSLQRANIVADIMVSEGVPRELLETVGYGDTQQMTSESTASDLQRNRRVEFSILVRQDGTAGGY